MPCLQSFWRVLLLSSRLRLRRKPVKVIQTPLRQSVAQPTQISPTPRPALASSACANTPRPPRIRVVALGHVLCLPLTIAGPWGDPVARTPCLPLKGFEPIPLHHSGSGSCLMGQNSLCQFFTQIDVTCVCVAAAIDQLAKKLDYVGFAPLDNQPARGLVPGRTQQRVVGCDDLARNRHLTPQFTCALQPPLMGAAEPQRGS